MTELQKEIVKKRVFERRKLTVSTIIAVIFSIIVLIVLWLGFKNCIWYEYKCNEYGVPMIIEDGWGNRFEYVRPAQNGDICFRNPFHKDKSVYDRWYYEKVEDKETD